MSFQGSINNLLSTVAVAGRLSPEFEAKQAAAAAGKKLKVLEKQEAQITSATEGSTEHKIYQDIQEQKQAAAKQLFEAKPSSKTYNQYRQARWYAGEPVMTTPADPEEILIERANAEAEANLLRENERVQRTRAALMQNAPKPMTGKKETIKYDNI